MNHEHMRFISFKRENYVECSLNWLNSRLALQSNSVTDNSSKCDIYLSRKVLACVRLLKGLVCLSADWAVVEETIPGAAC